MERHAGGLRHAPPGARAVAHRERGQLDRGTDRLLHEGGELSDARQGGRALSVDFDEILDADGLAQAEHLRAGDLSPAELVEASIARIEARNPALNAVIHPLFEKARRQVEEGRLVEGPFTGVPFLVKDAVCQTEGDPYHCGMRVLREAGHTADHDTELARRFRNAGFVFVGKTNTPELAMSATTEPVAYGATHNPWKLDRSPGGSSGGSASAVAARLVAAAHANDMGGSIRVPAAHCGLVGLKPTRGRGTLAPDFGEYWGPLTHEHVVTRSVRDSAAILDAIAGAAPGDPYSTPPLRPFLDAVGAPAGRLRVARVVLPAELGASPEVEAVVDDVARRLEAMGHGVEALALDPLFRVPTVPWMGPAIARELDRWGERIGRPLTADDVEPFNWMIAESGRALTTPEYVKRCEECWSWCRELVLAWTEHADLLLMPTCAQPAPPLGALAPEVPLGELGLAMLRYTALTMPFDVTGEPAISLPAQLDSDGVPIGVQLVAPAGREDRLFRVAAALEAELGWEQRRPELASA